MTVRVVTFQCPLVVDNRVDCAGEPGMLIEFIDQVAGGLLKRDGQVDSPHPHGAQTSESVT